MQAIDISKAGLTTLGFNGWIPIVEVLNRVVLPNTGGVYAVALAEVDLPIFSETSSEG